jgi:hypothetical protein
MTDRSICSERLRGVSMGVIGLAEVTGLLDRGGDETAIDSML